jgi:UDP-3-O-[3-hydroxymyristoyl] glucosamine N-acyltransferase
LEKTSAEIAALVNGKLEGDPSIVIRGVAGLREAQSDQISFLEHPRYAGSLKITEASVIIIGLDAEVPDGKTVIRVSQPSNAFGKIVSLISPKEITFASGIHPKALISPTAQIDPSASIQAFAVIEDKAVVGAKSVIGAGCYIGHESIIGSDCLLYPNVVIRERCLIGNRVIIHPGAVVGSDGFGYDFVEGRYKKIPQVGIVQLDDDVEIGSNTTIDRGRFGKTWIKMGVKIDNLVQIAHNVIVDQNTAIAAQAGISGSTIVGKNVRIAGQVGTVGHVHIGDNSILGAQSGVNHDVQEGQFVFGYPAQEHKEAMKTHANIRRLPYLVERVRKLEEQIKTLLNQNSISK